MPALLHEGGNVPGRDSAGPGLAKALSGARGGLDGSEDNHIVLVTLAGVVQPVAVLAGGLHGDENLLGFVGLSRPEEYSTEPGVEWIYVHSDVFAAWEVEAKPSIAVMVAALYDEQDMIIEQTAKSVLAVMGLYLDKIERAFRLDSTGLSKVYRERAAACISRGRYDAAVSLCQKALELDHDDVEAQYQLGVAYMGTRSLEEAVSSFQKALKLDPDRAEIHFRLGVLYDSTGAADRAIASYRKAIKLDAGRADFHYALGVAQDKKGEHEQAIRSLGKAIELAPHVAKYHYRVGLVHDGQGQHPKAVAAFKKAVEAEDAEA